MFIILVSALSLTALSQRSAVDDLFDRYDGREGFTSVFISSKMFSLLSRIDSDDQEFHNLVNRIKSIRILSVDSASNTLHVNFAAELVPRLTRTGYEDLMTVKEQNDEIRFMVRESGGRIAELVMITGGAGSSVVCITGNLDLKTIASLSDNLGIRELEGLDKVEK